MKANKTYLDPVNVSLIANLELRAKLVVEGFITGLHKSPYHGFSQEFSEHRAYRPGDEIRNIDWKVYARSNRFYIKQYEEETNLRCMIAVDSSKSMAYGSKGHISKYQYATYLGQSIAYMMMGQRDAVGLCVYNDKIETYLPTSAKKNYIPRIIKTLEETVPSEKTSISSALNILAERIHRRGMVVIISDLFDDTESISEALKHFRHKGHEVLLFQTLDPREIDFDLGGGSTFVDMETGDEILTSPHQIQSAYKESMQKFLDSIKEICYKQNVDYHLALTNEPFDRSLLRFLSRRAKV